MELIIVIANIFMAVGVIYAALQFRIAGKQLRLQNLTTVGNIHMYFQKEIKTIQSKLPPSVNDEGWVANDEQDRLIYLYWQNVFDEWYFCRKINKDNEYDELNNLWCLYSSGAFSALRVKAFREKLKLMLDGQTSFLGRRDEFKQELQQIFRAKIKDSVGNISESKRNELEIFIRTF